MKREALRERVVAYVILEVYSSSCHLYSGGDQKQSVVQQSKAE
jgi:hypothetical protein